MNGSGRPLGRLIAAALSVLVLGPTTFEASAGIPGGGGDPTPTTAYFEQGLLIRAGEVVEALGPNLMGDSVNEYSGGLKFTQTDVSLPGNNALQVQVGRHNALGTIQAYAGAGLFANWDLDIPHLHTIATQKEPNWYGGRATSNFNRCSQFSGPPNTVDNTVMPSRLILEDSFWDGYHMYIPGNGDQTLLLRDPANTIAPSDGPYPIVTNKHWEISCLPTIDNGAGEGFEARSPDGVRYRFDHMAVRSWQTLTKPGYVPRVEIWVLPTLVTDRFGNWVRYAYGSPDGWRVSSITSSDGRSIAFTYNGNGNRIQSVSDGTRTWTYGYSAAGTLQTVTQPDGSSWTFAIDNLSKIPYLAGDPGCDTESDWASKPPASGTITHPSGAVGTFVLTLLPHGRSGIPGTPCSPLNHVGAYFAAWSLTSKTLSGPGMPAMTWSYAYSPAAGTFAPCNGCANTKSVTVTDPLNNVTVNTYGTQYSLQEGLLLSSNEGGGLRVTTFAYRAPDAGPYPSRVGSGTPTADSMSRIYTPQSQRTITQQGVTFWQTANVFDIYARPRSVTQSNSLGYTRDELIAYYDQTSLWVLGQIASQTIAGVVAKNTDYDTATATPSATYKFGKRQATYVFNADGTLYSVKDGLNHTTTFTNYKRGLPQSIGYADGRSISAVVNNIGTITSVTNEAGTTWSYGYDAMGRLASKTPPGGDPVAYNATTLSFVQVPSAEVGLEANHWRQTITTGTAVTINYFDARWRKRLITTYDAADRVNTERAQRFDYDPYNRTTFTAYPARSIASITATTPGTTAAYDALGRTTQSVSDSELGSLTATIQYLGQFQKRMTDPRGNVTTTAYQVFDEPSESAIASIAAPEGLNVTINRDIFGKPTAITRSGTYASAPVSATRSYVYDGNQLLCKTIEPETGATIQKLDAANNVSWRATGLGLINTSGCDWDSVAAANIVAYAFDARNRVTGTGFGDGSPSIGRSYTADGLPLTVVSNGSTWTYGYNNRRLFTSESLTYGQTYSIGRSYDGNGNLSQVTYPDTASVVYNPNALGEAKQASGYASGVSYHPNGAVAAYTLANGVAHTLSQNVRGLPLVNRDAGVTQDQYSYDANGNVSAIVDQQEGVTSRTMGYDGLDRLTSASAPGVWGSASYGYDQLGNIRTGVVGGRNAIHNYGANNLLATINTNGVYTGYVYDPRGNVIGRGDKGFYFDLGNRMALANGVASYTYDGLGRRTSISGVGGDYRVQVYGQGGQLLYGAQQQGMSSGTTRYVYLGGKLIAETNSAGGTNYIHTDALASVVASVSNIAATLSYTCPSGWTLSGSTCTQATSSTVPATIGYTCPSGYTLSGSTCSQTTTTTSAATPNYNCPAGWTLSGSTCSLTNSTPATPIYACPSGFTLSGSTCSSTTTAAANVNWNCNGHGALQAYAPSPSGYYCVVYRVTAAAYNQGDFRGEVCQARADSYGLVWVGHQPYNAQYMDCFIGPVPIYSCPAGATLSGTTCTSTVTQAASIGSYTCSSGTLSGSSCFVTNTTAASVGYSCPAGQSLSGSTCSLSTTATTVGMPYYSCPSGYTLSGTTCSSQGTASTSATVVYGCPNGGTLSGSMCVGVVQRTMYEAYGNTAAGTVRNDVGFTGHMNDAATGLVYMQQRYYDPIAARFLSVDPSVTDANNGHGFNRHAYVNNNPYRYTDPAGEFEMPLIVDGFVETIWDHMASWRARPFRNTTTYSEQAIPLLARRSALVML